MQTQINKKDNYQTLIQQALTHHQEKVPVNNLSFQNQNAQNNNQPKYNSSWDPITFWKDKSIKSHKDRLAYLQGKKNLEQFYKMTNWGQMMEWHKKNSPWLDNSALKKIVILYNQQAKQRMQKNKLNEHQKWMTVLP